MTACSQSFHAQMSVYANTFSPLAAGMVGHNSGVIMSASININIKLFGKGGHGSLPQVAVDPVVMASSLVMKLQTIRSRELAGDIPAVITIGFIRAGTKHNVIPDEAHIGLNIHTEYSRTASK